MNKMVKKLLILNEIEFGKSPVEFQRFNIVELINSVLSMTEILFKKKILNYILKQQSLSMYGLTSYW